MKMATSACLGLFGIIPFIVLLLIIGLLSLLLLTGCSNTPSGQDRDVIHTNFCNSLNMTYISSFLVPFNGFECIDGFEVNTYYIEDYNNYEVRFR